MTITFIDQIPLIFHCVTEKNEAVASLEKKIKELENDFEMKFKERLAEQAEKVCMIHSVNIFGF